MVAPIQGVAIKQPLQLLNNKNKVLDIAINT
jgi:hypothetical protein